MKSSGATSQWSIGDVAQTFGLATHVLRYWEEVGLLRPERDGGGRRRYRRADLVRVAVIVRNKSAGMSLDQIAALLDADADGRRLVLASHIARVQERMQDMRLSLEMTTHALDCSAHDVITCPNFAARVQDLMDGRSIGLYDDPPVGWEPVPGVVEVAEQPG